MPASFIRKSQQKGHLLRKVNRAVDFGKLYEIVEPLYNEDEDGPA